MFLPSWFGFIRPSTRRTPSGRKPGRQRTANRRSLRLSLEQLEDRTLMSNYTAATVSDLIADINASNQAGGLNTIALVAGKTFSLTGVDNATDGATGLPVIAANDNLRIVGNGDTIERSAATGTPAFRLVDVALNAALALQNLTLQGGLAFGSGVSPEGGAIYNQGTLTLNGVTVQNNVARGSDGARPGQSAAGGGIYSNGTLTLEGNTKVQSNLALGGQGGYAASGGSAGGGGVCVAAGTVTMTSTVLSSNRATGGRGGMSIGPSGGPGGNGFGGGVYAFGGTITLHNDTVTGNTAQGGSGGYRFGMVGRGEGGGLYINYASVCLDAFTLANVIYNSVSWSYPNIYGSYTIFP
jgi:hypothetical protein